MTGVYSLVGFFLLLFVAAVLLTRLVKRGEQTEKSIGELMREEQAEVIKHVEIANEVRQSVPVRGASERVSDRWDRSDKSLLDRRTADGGLDPGQIGRRDGEGN